MSQLSGLYLVLALCVTCSAPAAAQGGADTWQDLAQVTRVGQQVRVSDRSGQTIQGKVVSISNDHLVVSQQRQFRSPLELTFTEASAATIEAVDSRWNGFLIGGAVGFGVAAASVKLCCPRSDGAAAVFLMPLIAAAGALIDGSRNKTIYRGSQRPEVGIAPWIERERKGVVLHARF